MDSANEPKKQTKKWYKKWWGILLIIFLVINIVGALTARESSNEKTNETAPSTESSVKYIQPEKKIVNTEVVGTNYIVATGYLVNNTSETGVADCNIEFYDREINWAGGKGLGGRELKPNERYDFTVQVEVENTGLISKQNIDCEDGV